MCQAKFLVNVPFCISFTVTIDLKNFEKIEFWFSIKVEENIVQNLGLKNFSIKQNEFISVK